MVKTPEPELSWRTVDKLLLVWGEYVRLTPALSVGCYPSQSSNIGLCEPAKKLSWKTRLTAKGSQTRGAGHHRILCESGWAMPDYIKRIHVAVSCLPEKQYDAVIVKYATGLDARGHEWPRELMAFAIGASLEALDDRLAAARKKIGRLLAKTPGRRVFSCHRAIADTAA